MFAGNSIKELHLRDCVDLRTSTLTAVLSTCPQVELLDLETTPNQFSFIEAIVRHLPNLRALFINGWRLTKNAHECLIENGQKLEAIGLAYAGFNSKETVLAYFALANMKFLKIQTATKYTHVKVLDCLNVAPPSLLAVHLICCGTLDGKDKVHRQFLSIKWLALDTVTITDEGIAQLLPLCPKLKVLQITGINGELTGAGWLPTIGDFCPDLEIICLRHAPRTYSVNLVTSYKMAAAAYPKIVMIGKFGILPPNHDLFPEIMRPAHSIEETLGVTYPRLDALDKDGIPFADCWMPAFYIKNAR